MLPATSETAAGTMVAPAADMRALLRTGRGQAAGVVADGARKRMVGVVADGARKHMVGGASATSTQNMDPEYWCTWP
eukprot:4320747-Prymnesium_polylepis.2